jgi:hypothetical protein
VEEKIYTGQKPSNNIITALLLKKSVSKRQENKSISVGKVIGEPWFPGNGIKLVILTLKTLIYEGANGIISLVTDFVT